MDPLESIRENWGWKGLDPVEIVRSGAFGNAIVRDTEERYWWIIPVNLEAEVVAASPDELEELFADEWFVRDWEMAGHVELASSTLGPLEEGRCYWLKIPVTLGGKFEPANLGTVPRWEALGVSGSLAEQIDGLPDGAVIELKVINQDDAKRQGG